MDWKRPYILIVNLAYRAGHDYIGILNTLFRSFCEFPVTCVLFQSVVTPLGASGWCIGRIIHG